MNKVEKHFDKVAKEYDFYKKKNSFYYDNLKRLLRSKIPGNKKVFEVGCGTGDLMNNLVPSSGYGYDISSKMISIAQEKYGGLQNLHFSTKWPKGKFEYIFMSDVIEHLQKPKTVFEQVYKSMNNKSKFIITMANPLWEPFLMFGEKIGYKMPEGPHKRISFKDIEKMVNDLGMEVSEHDYKLLVPVKIPFLTDFANRYFEKPLKKLAFIEYFVITKSQ